MHQAILWANGARVFDEFIENYSEAKNALDDKQQRLMDAFDLKVKDFDRMIEKLQIEGRKQDD